MPSLSRCAPYLLGSSLRWLPVPPASGERARVAVHRNFDCSNLINELVIKPDGSIPLDEAIKPEKRHRAIVTIVEETSVEAVPLLNEHTLATDWLKPEEET